jgi:hypothetical protein
MKQRFQEMIPDADQRQEERFDIWMAADGIPFSDEAAKTAYRDRAAFIKDAIQLKRRPDRVPVCPSAGFFPIEYAGKTMYEAMYDYRVLQDVWEKYHIDFAPDAYTGPTNIVPGRVLEILDFNLYHWPGHGVPKDGEYQFVEKEYMKQEEYQDLIDDPTAFFLSKYFPRIFGALKPFEGLPLFPPVNELPSVPPAMIPFGWKTMQAALAALGQAGEEALLWRTKAGVIAGRIMGKGFPAFVGGSTKAPFDVIGDSLRGTKGIMLDMYRCPDVLKEACERLTPLMVKCGVASCKANGHIMPFIPLHKGADGFLSDEMFRTFYWPTLRELIIGLINEGMVPLLFAEGGYDQRLEVISDIPKGKTVWWFDRTDMVMAKETVGKFSCIAGNFPLSLLCTSSPGEVREYCQELIEIMATDGGFIFSTGAGMQGAKVENVRTMIDTMKEVGV